MKNISLVFASETLAREGCYELAKLHFHQNDRDLMGRELRFFDDLIDRLVTSAKCFQNSVFLGAEVYKVFDWSRFVAFCGGKVEMGEILEDLRSVGNEDGSFSD